MSRIHSILLLALTLLLAACGGSAMQSAAPSAPINSAEGGAAAPPMPAGDVAALEQAPGAPATEPSGKPAAQANTVERLVIKTADLSLQVDDARAAETQLRELVGQLGGYIVKVETSGTDERVSTRVTFRVPAERFDDALGGAQGLAKKLLARTVGGDDVTEEFVDLDARLRNLEATRDRLLTFLDKATEVEDALRVNESLSQIQGEIEQIKGRQQFLQRSAALSTISVYLTPTPITPIIDEDSWQPLDVARRALRDLVAFGQGLAEIAIVLVIWAPVWLTLLLAAIWAWRKLRRRRAPAAAAAPAAPESAQP